MLRSDGSLALGDLNRCRVMKIRSWSLRGRDEVGTLKSSRDGVGTVAAVERCPFRVHTSRGKWRAPEEHRGDFLDEKIDVFSLGLVLWSLLTRRAPFASLSDAQAAAIVAAGGRPSLGLLDCRGELRAIACAAVRACWAQNPTARPRSSDVVEMFQKALRSAEVPSNKVLDAI
jgi:hypothetical protein